MVNFIECSSLSVNYDVSGLATVSYTYVVDSEYIGSLAGKSPYPMTREIIAGGQKFTGYIVNASLNPIQNSMGWYEIHLTMIALATPVNG